MIKQDDFLDQVMKAYQVAIKGSKTQAIEINGYETLSFIDSTPIKKLINESFYLYGNVGSGKTYTAKIIQKIFNKYLKATKFLDWSEFYRSFSDEDFNQKKYEIKTIRLLIIDDLGANKFTDFQIDLFFEILNSRLENNLSTIITSNFTKEALLNKIEIIDPSKAERIKSRLYQFHLVYFNGEDIRKKSAKKNWSFE